MARVTSWNAGAERLFGYAAEEIVGRPINLVIPPDRPDEETSILGRIRRGESIERYESQRVTKVGTLIDVLLTISPIRDGTGGVIGSSKIARDITAWRRAQQELQRRNGPPSWPPR